MESERNIIDVQSDQISLNDKSYKEAGYVRLPYNASEFKEFIKGLLGEPQSIDGRIYGIFSISITEIENLYHLIDQRIQSQNNGQLVQFISKTAYNNKSMVTLNSLNEFITYNEIRPIIPIALHLS